MCIDYLPGDRQSEPGMGAEFLASRALAIEAVEDGGQLVLRYPGTLVLDADEDGAAIEARMDPNLAIRWAERDGIRDHVDEDLRQPGLDAGDDQVTLLAGNIERQMGCPFGPRRLMHIDEGPQHRT